MSITDNIIRIKNEIDSNVQLICVSKTRTIEEIKEAYNAGERNFGENKVQEFISKYNFFNKDVNWHIIGHLQTNKVKYIVGKVYLIHSLDSIKLLNEIEKRYAKNNITANVLIQINIGCEKSKSGIFLEKLEDLIEECEKCNNVKVKGLMAIIPKGNESNNRNYFRKMKLIYEQLKKRNFKNITMKILSMGMSGDYNIAVDEGANMIRIGEGIFGKRIYKSKGGI